MANKKATEVLTPLFSLAGVSADNASLTQVIEALKEVELDEETVNKIQQNLIPKDGAKNNSEVVNAIKAPLFNAIDSKFDKLMTDGGFTEDEKRKVLGDGKNTFDKPDLFYSVLRERQEKAISELGEDSQKVDSIKSQYDDKIKEIIREKEEAMAKTQSLVEQHSNELRGMHLTGIFKSHKYANGLSSEHGAVIANNEFNKFLQKEGLTIIGENGNYKLMDGDLPYTKDHKEVGISDCISSVLAENNLLAANEKPVEKEIVVSQQEGVKGLDKFQQEIDRRIADSQHVA